MLILFDRDGTLIEDVPYNNDPARVRTRPTAEAAVSLARWAGARIGVISNQSGIARGLLTDADVRAVNARVERALGPFDLMRWCPHGPEQHCACRAPRPGLVIDAATRVGETPATTVVIGDSSADIGAASACGARGILVPAPSTRQGVIDHAPEVASTLLDAVRLAISRPAPPGRARGSGMRGSGVRRPGR